MSKYNVNQLNAKPRNKTLSHFLVLPFVQSCFRDMMSLMFFEYRYHPQGLKMIGWALSTTFYRDLFRGHKDDKANLVTWDPEWNLPCLNPRLPSQTGYHSAQDWCISFKFCGQRMVSSWKTRMDNLAKKSSKSNCSGPKREGPFFQASCFGA